VTVPRGRAALTVVLLAAGQGTRMRSGTIKLLHAVAGRPMVRLALDAVQALRPARTIVVVGFQADRVREALAGAGCTFALQERQRGTGDAVVQAAQAIHAGPRGILLVVNGDLPRIRPATLRKLVGRHRRSAAALSFLTTHVEDPAGYGRIVRDARGNLLRIVEQTDATREERGIREINCGIYCAQASKLLPVLRRLRPANAQGEYYITDAVQRMIAAGEKVLAVPHGDAGEVLGVNTRAELAHAAAAIYARKAAELQDRGVTLLDPSRTWVDPRARVGRDSVLYPGVIVEGATVLGRRCVVRPGCRIADCRIASDVEIQDHSVLQESEVGRSARVGPFAHLRPGSVLGPETRVGNFVELKKARLGRGTKASHLSYLGDAEIGPDCNIGAGTITCNYDGTKKHPTVLDRGVFIGSDTQLVAPVTVRRGAYVAAGTTVTQDVPAGALAIGRGRQRNIEGWVARKRREK
jgi:bifunctional UDP-N-acetylglucosamine pyrophosphorylase/glucosamine-1-phosphate N-acetyltransferase